MLRLSATLVFIGFVLFEVMGALHAPGANDHRAAFTSYAGSGDWTAVHLGEFVAMALMIAGLLVLYFALDVSAGAAHWMGFFGAVSAGIALALYAVLQAVDGVANKQADLAWLSAPAAEQAARFASAEAIRWVEWGLKSYQGYTLGLALLLFGIAIAATARVPRPIGYLMGLSGLAFIVSGWVIGVQGFADIGAAPSDLAQFFLPVSMIWLLVVAWRRTSSLQPAAAQIGEARYIDQKLLPLSAVLLLVGELLAGRRSWAARVPRPMDYLMGVAGLAFVLLGWMVGTAGFT